MSCVSEFFSITHCVNKTSIVCIAAGCLNAFLPMAAVNEEIFGKHNEKIDHIKFSTYDDDFEFLTVRIVFFISY